MTRHLSFKPALTVMFAALVSSGCLCGSAAVCRQEAEATIAEGASGPALALDATAREIADTFARACELGDATSCREALAYWTTRPEKQRDYDADREFLLEVVHEPEAVAEEVRGLLGQLIRLSLADAERRDSREGWSAIEREFPGTRAAERAERERSRIIIAELEADGSVEAHLRELVTPTRPVLDYIEDFAAGLQSASGDGETLSRMALRLAELRPDPAAVGNIVRLADAACFEDALKRDAVAGWEAYLQRFGPKSAGLDERVATPHTRKIRVPSVSDYRIEVSASSDVDLEISVDGRSVCSRTSSAANERCELTRVRAGAEVSIHVKGAREARLIVQGDGASSKPDVLAGQGRFVERARGRLDVARGREALGISDPRQAARRLESLLSDGHDTALSQLRTMLAEARERVRKLEAREAIDDPGVSRGLTFLGAYRDAPERELVASTVAKRLAARADSDDSVSDYDSFLARVESGPLHQTVQNARRRVAARIAAEERRQAMESARAEAEARREAAREAAEERRQRRGGGEGGRWRPTYSDSDEDLETCSARCNALGPGTGYSAMSADGYERCMSRCGW
jgi:hypothetical protein